MTSTIDRLVHDYLAALESAAAGLPPDARRDLVADIREHLDQALGSPPYDEISVRTVIDRLGEPEEIAAEAGGRTPASTQPRLRVRDAVGLALLPFGRFSAGESIGPDGTVVTTPEVSEDFALPQVVGVPLLVVLVAAPVAVVLHLASRAAPDRS
jgi:hypothetical protein